MRLPELLLADGVLDVATVEEVQESQAIYGGSFDTNLLELGRIDEQKLQPYLERALGVKNRVNVFGDPSASAASRLPRRQAEAARAVPFKLTGRTLDVVLNDPTDVRALDEIGFITGQRVQLNVATEARVAHLMSRAYGIPVPSRLASLLAGRVWPKPEIAARRRASQEHARVSGEIDVEMADEEPAGEAMPSIDAPGVSAVYDGGGAPSYVGAAGPVMPGPTSSSSPSPTPMVRAFTRSVQFEAPAPPLMPEVIRRAQTAPTFTQAAADEPVRRSYEVIAAQLEATEDRDQIPPIALGYLSTLLSRVVLLSVRKHDLHGWDARGKKLRRETVETLSFPLDRPSIFARVAASGQPYEGPLPRESIEESFAIKLGVEAWPDAVMILPIRVRGRAVALLYCEAASRPLMLPAREPIGVIVNLLSEAFVRLILERKQTNS